MNIKKEKLHREGRTGQNRPTIWKKAKRTYNILTMAKKPLEQEKRMKYKIICDSSANLLPGMFPEDDIVSFANVPLSIFVGSKAYCDDGTADVPEMMDRIIHTNDKTTTSCPSPNEFLKEMTGADYYIVITISSKLSGSYNSAYLAKTSHEKPENVFVLDSLLTAGAMELMAEEAYRLAHQDIPFDQLCDKLVSYRKNVNLLFVLDKFDNLIKMGRVSKVVGFIAKKFKIKPLCCGENGEIKIKEKVRTIQGVLKRLIVNIGLVCPDQKGRKCIISHTDAEKSVDYLKGEIEKNYHFDSVIVRKNNALCSFYAMQGGLIVAF